MFNVDADTSTPEKGVWLEFRGSEFLLAHTSSLKFQKALARLQSPHRKRIEQGKLDPETNRQIICQAMSEGIILSWRKVVNAKKEAVDYSPDLAAKLLIKDTEFRDWVSEMSMNLTNFLEEETQEVGES
jgi:hypothetical protein